MSNTRCEIFNWLLVPTTAIILLCIWTKSAIFELLLTYILCILSTGAHIHYGTHVVRNKIIKITQKTKRIF